MELRPKSPFEYPKYNTQTFEEYFYEYYNLNKPNIDRVYLDVFWTSFYLNKNYGQGDISDLQSYIDSLDKSKKYFTLVQYDDGILNDVSGIDLYIFSLAQDKIYDYILPTTCLPKIGINKNRDRDIFCSSYGRYKGEPNHPLQDKLISTLSDQKYSIGKQIDIDRYYDILERSVFFICVNGRSPTTFKICECFQHGTIPVFLYDKWWVPFEDQLNFEDACVMINENNIDNIDNILSNIPIEKVRKMREYGSYIYNNFYKYDSLAEKIIEIVKNV